MDKNNDDPTSRNAGNRVLIIGFGLSGIVQAHSFVANGFEDITVVEAEESFGGVWNTTKHYPGLATNNSKSTFELPEMRAEPGSFDDYPTQEQVNGYLQQYIAKFDLEKYVHYSTRVQHLTRRQIAEGGGDKTNHSNINNNQWIFDVQFSKPVNGAMQSTFDFVVCATGFTCIPNIPEQFQQDVVPEGVTVLHSSEIRKAMAENPDLVKGKRFAVIGTAKSGHDAANWAAEYGDESTTVDLIGHKMHWSVPRYFLEDPVKGLAENEIIYSGLMSYLLPCNPAVFKAPRLGGGDGFGWSFGIFRTCLVLNFLHKTKVGRSLRDFIWKMKMTELVQKVGVPSHLVPKQTFCEDARYLSVQNPFFWANVKKGKIDVVLERPHGFDPEGGKSLLLQDEDGNFRGKEYDVIICATGFGSSFGFLSDEINEKLYNEKGQAQLFRNVFCPSLPQMGFLGFHLNTNSMITSSVGAKWIVELAKGTNGSLHRRGVTANHSFMQHVIDAGLKLDAHGSARPKGYYTTGVSPQRYADPILNDMGSKYYKRYPLLAPLLPSMYEGLMTENLDAA